MCVIKTSANVATSVDLQNLVTGIVLRQSSPFSIKNIEAQVKDKLVGSELYSNEDTVKEMCRHTVELMELTGGVRVTEDGHYRLTIPYASHARVWTGTK